MARPEEAERSDRSTSDEHLARVAAYHDACAEDYDAHYEQHFPLYHRVTWSNIRRYLPDEPDSLILDAGGGTGTFAVKLAQMGYRLVLTDVSDGMLAQARRKVADFGLEDRISIVPADVCAMPELEDGQFALALCEGDPLSYCEDAEAGARELARVVRPGGFVIASVDNRPATLKQLTEEQGQQAVEGLLAEGRMFVPHEQEELSFVGHSFTAHELRNLFERVGLTVERLIGKLVIAPRLSCYRSENPAIQDWLLDLELTYSEDPAYIPLAGHLEIVGRRP